MSDLVTFLRARLDEEAAAAKCGQEIRAMLDDRNRDITLDVRNGAEFVWQRIGYDPTQVLREVEAKRQIVELHDQVGWGDPQMVTCDVCGDREGSACLTLRLLALPYTVHPDYDEAWRP